MNFTATIIGQILTFAVLVWFMKAVLWEPMLNMLEERRKRVAEGLAAAERGVREQELAERRAAEVLRDAKAQAQEIIGRAERRGVEIVDEAKRDAKAEGERIVAAARSEIERETNQAREALRAQVAGLAVAGARQILSREVDEAAHSNMLQKLAAGL